MGRSSGLMALVAVSGGTVAVVLCVSGWQDLREQADAGLFVLLACIVLGELIVVVRSLPVRIETSTGSIFAFAALLDYGPTAGAVGMGLASVLVDAAHRKPARVTAANAGAWTLALAAAGGVLALLVGSQTPPGGELTLANIPAIAAAAVVMSVVNYVLIMTMLAVDLGVPILAFVRDDAWAAAADDVAGLSLGTVIGLAGVRGATAPLLLLPFVLVAGGRKAVEGSERGMFDPLTGLPNRALFHDRAEQALQRAARDGSGGAVLLVDLDGFKAINDSLGHQAGDAVLEEVARRLCRCVRGSDTVARLGGDEFALLVSSPNDALDAAERVRHNIVAALEERITVAGAHCSVGGSVGIAYYPDDGNETAALIERADQAMYTDKRARQRLPQSS